MLRGCKGPTLGAMVPGWAELRGHCAQSRLGDAWPPETWSSQLQQQCRVAAVSGGSRPALGWVVPRSVHRERAEQLGLRSLLVCILNISSCMCTAGTWPVHCVCSSYLVGCAMCGGVAKGSGNVDFFQCNHTDPTTTSPAPGLCCLPLWRGSCQELLGWEEGKGRRFVLTDR